MIYTIIICYHDTESLNVEEFHGTEKEAEKWASGYRSMDDMNWVEVYAGRLSNRDTMALALFKAKYSELASDERRIVRENIECISMRENPVYPPVYVYGTEEEMDIDDVEIPF